MINPFTFRIFLSYKSDVPKTCKKGVDVGSKDILNIIENFQFKRGTDVFPLSPLAIFIWSKKNIFSFGILCFWYLYLLFGDFNIKSLSDIIERYAQSFHVFCKIMDPVINEFGHFS